MWEIYDNKKMNKAIEKTEKEANEILEKEGWLTKEDVYYLLLRNIFEQQKKPY